MPRPYPDSAKRENFCGGWDFQKAQDRQRSSPGAGLGLSLVRAIAEAHGGSITLSDNQPGLRATITLPERHPISNTRVTALCET